MVGSKPDRLADALEIGDLALVATEHSVGPFALDILAETVDGAKVIVENQLEASDHRHLGQCITYASGIGASVVIWVLKRLLPEHRAALDWLNEHTDESINFFGVELSAVRIGNSDPAPIFSVRARPNDWQKQARAGSGGTSPTRKWRGWNAAYDALASISGSWTAIQDLAEFVGTTPNWMARHMYGKWHLPGLHRMLLSDGSVWRHFHWPDKSDTRDPMAILEAEGVALDGRHRADQAQRLRAEQLAEVLTSPGS